MDKMEMSVCAHLGRAEDDAEFEAEVYFTSTASDVVTVKVKQGYPGITFFMSLLQFNQLRAAINKFDVAGG